MSVTTVKPQAAFDAAGTVTVTANELAGGVLVIVDNGTKAAAPGVVMSVLLPAKNDLLAKLPIGKSVLLTIVTGTLTAHTNVQITWVTQADYDESISPQPIRGANLKASSQRTFLIGRQGDSLYIHHLMSTGGAIVKSDA